MLRLQKQSEDSMAKLRLRTNVIPPMTNPLGAHWPQPDRSEVFTDDANAYMSASSAKRLYHYDRSMPSGVYDGKMWLRNHGNDDYLWWFGPAEDPNQCTTNYRKLVITDG